MLVYIIILLFLVHVANDIVPPGAGPLVWTMPLSTSICAYICRAWLLDAARRETSDLIINRGVGIILFSEGAAIVLSWGVFTAIDRVSGGFLESLVIGVLFGTLYTMFDLFPILLFALLFSILASLLFRRLVRDISESDDGNRTMTEM